MHASTDPHEKSSMTESLVLAIGRGIVVLCLEIFDIVMQTKAKSKEISVPPIREGHFIISWKNNSSESEI